jgi:hypothetical protein
LVSQAPKYSPPLLLGRSPQILFFSGGVSGHFRSYVSINSIKYIKIYFDDLDAKNGDEENRARSVNLWDGRPTQDDS